MKNERVKRPVYLTREHARVDVTRYIELRHARIRLHSAHGYRTPDEAENTWHKQNKTRLQIRNHCPEAIVLLIGPKLHHFNAPSTRPEMNCF